MRPSLPSRSRSLALAGMCLMLVALFAFPSVANGSPASFAPAPHMASRAPSPSSSVGATPHAPPVYQNTSIYTSARGAGINVGLNWSLRTNFPYISGPIDISTGGQVIQILGSEYVLPNDHDGVGFMAWDNAGTTEVNPEIMINGTVYVDGSVNLQPTASSKVNVNFEMVHTGGDWWAFSAGSNLIDVNGVTNGTYNLTTRAAFANGWLKGPMLNVTESGPALPISNNEFYAVATPAIEVNSTRSPTVGAVPSDGIYLSDQLVAADSVPMLGIDQIPAGTPLPFGLPNGYVAINPPSIAASYQTVVNGTYLWGAAAVGVQATKAWLGAETQDPTDTNVTGARIATAIAGQNVHVPADQAIVTEDVVPINGSYDLGLGFVDTNVSFTYGNFSINLLGTYPILVVYNSTTILNFWINLVQTPGSLDIYSVQEASTGSWWWSVYMNGGPLNSGWTSDSGSTTFNGTFNLNQSTMWGDMATPFHAETAGNAFLAGVNIPFLVTDQPMLAFFGNSSAYWYNSSIVMHTNAGWTTPLWGYAWSYNTQDDVLFGGDQHPALLPGTVIVGNSTAFSITKPLTNGTALWTATLVHVWADPYTIDSGNSLATGGTAQLVITITFASNPVNGALLTSCGDALGLGQCQASGFLANPNYAGVYYDNFTATTIVSALTSDLLTFVVSTAHGAAVGSALINITAPVSLNALIEGSGTSVTLHPGGTMTLEAWTNQSSLPFATNVVVEGAFIPVTDGPQCTFTSTVTGVWSCGITTYSTLICPSSPCSTSISVATSGLGVNVASVTLDVTIVSFTMSISAITATPQAGSTLMTVAAGSNVTLSVTVSTSSGPFDSATVAFALTPTIPGATLTTSSPTNGVYTVKIVVPKTLTMATWYNVTATATSPGYATVATPAEVSFVVWPPTSTTGNNNNGNGGGSSNGLSSPLVLGAIVGVVAVVVVALLAVMMMRKKKQGGESNAPKSWSGPAAESGAPSPEGTAGSGEPPA